MANRVNQSTIPSFNTEASFISPMKNGTVLFCESFNTERKNFIVVDQASIIADSIAFGETTVQKAYDNGWITEFGTSTDYVTEKYVYAFTGADYNNNQHYFSCGKLFRQDKSKFVITKNGTTLNNSEWNFGTVGASWWQFNSTHFSTFQMTTAPVASDVYIITYTEEIYLGDDYRIKLFSEYSDDLRNTKITKTFHSRNWSGGAHGWCADISQSGNNAFEVTYKNFADESDEILIEKVYPTGFRLAEFEQDFDFSTVDLVLEVYRNTTPNPTGTIRTRSEGGSSNLEMLVTTNNIDINDINQKKQQGVYSFRFYNTATRQYSRFFKNKVSIKAKPLIQTDSSLSLEFNRGYFYRAMIV